MKRRSFLKAITVAAPAAGLQDFIVRQARAQVPATQPHVVGAGEDHSAHSMRKLPGSTPETRTLSPDTRLEWVGPSPFWKA